MLITVNKCAFKCFDIFIQTLQENVTNNIKQCYRPYLWCIKLILDFLFLLSLLFTNTSYNNDIYIPILIRPDVSYFMYKLYTGTKKFMFNIN